MVRIVLLASFLTKVIDLWVLVSYKGLQFVDGVRLTLEG
jgi:hypothetical protein